MAKHEALLRSNINENNVIFTDLFRLLQPINIRKNFITYSKFDSEFFSRYIDASAEKIHVNPPKKVSGSLYTVPLEPQYNTAIILGNLKDLQVVREISAMPISMETVGVQDVILTLNDDYNASDNFKILLQHLNEYPTIITEELYERIDQYIKTYKELITDINILFAANIKKNHLALDMIQDAGNIKDIFSV